MAKKAPKAPVATAKKVYEAPKGQLSNILKVKNLKGVTFVVNRAYYDMYKDVLTVVNDA
jgi:hypothetical protein